MQRRDNPEMALAAAARDQAEFTRDLRRRLPTFDIPYSDNRFDISKVTKKTAIFLTIGMRGDLTKQQAKTAAEKSRSERDLRWSAYVWPFGTYQKPLSACGASSSASMKACHRSY